VAWALAEASAIVTSKAARRLVLPPGVSGLIHVLILRSLFERPTSCAA
jgi:hypothetical protein